MYKFVFSLKLNLHAEVEDARFETVFFQKGVKASFNSVVNPEIKLFPLIIDVVATEYSVVLSSCCDKKRRADISAYVHPPTKRINTFLVPVEESCPPVLTSLSSFL